MLNKIIIENTLIFFEVKEIEKLRIISKKFKNVIDKSTFIWYTLIKRDFKGNNSHGNSKIQYKKLQFKLISDIKHHLKLLSDVENGKNYR